MTSHTELYQQHLAPEMRVLIFSGDVDACVPYLGTMRWVADVAEGGAGPVSHGLQLQSRWIIPTAAVS